MRSIVSMITKNNRISWNIKTLYVHISHILFFVFCVRSVFVLNCKTMILISAPNRINTLIEKWIESKRRRWKWFNCFANGKETKPNQIRYILNPEQRNSQRQAHETKFKVKKKLKKKINECKNNTKQNKVQRELSPHYIHLLLLWIFFFLHSMR